MWVQGHRPKATRTAPRCALFLAPRGDTWIRPGPCRRWLGALVLAFLLPRLALGQALPDARPLSPTEWAELILSDCAREEKSWEESLAALQAELSATAQSTEQLAFADAELLARRHSLDKERRSAFARLDYFLFGPKAKSFAEPEARFRRAFGVPRPRGTNPFRRTLGLLLAEASPCSLDALESTLFFAIFDVPFTRTQWEAGFGLDQVYAQLDRAYQQGLEKFGSLEEVFIVE